jgi:hypothetical protein
MNAEVKTFEEAAENQRSTSLKIKHAFWKNPADEVVPLPLYKSKIG